jgi:hypothetical protein
MNIQRLLDKVILWYPVVKSELSDGGIVLFQTLSTHN